MQTWTAGRKWLAETPHIWLGVSVANKKHGVQRIDQLRRGTAYQVACN